MHPSIDEGILATLAQRYDIERVPVGDGIIGVAFHVYHGRLAEPSFVSSQLSDPSLIQALMNSAMEPLHEPLVCLARPRLDLQSSEEEAFEYADSLEGEGESHVFDVTVRPLYVGMFGSRMGGMLEQAVLESVLPDVCIVWDSIEMMAFNPSVVRLHGVYTAKGYQIISTGMEEPC